MDRALWQDRRGERQTSVETVASIEGAHLLLERFGSWPTFEDFEIISLHFDRGNAMDIFQTKAWSNLKEPSIVVALYGFDIRYSSTDAERKPTVINIRFQGSFERVALDGFNHQNPICGMEIIFEYSDNLKKNVFAVDWGGTGIHHDVSFTCERIEVLEVKPL